MKNHETVVHFDSGSLIAQTNHERVNQFVESHTQFTLLILPCDALFRQYSDRMQSGNMLMLNINNNINNIHFFHFKRSFYEYEDIVIVQEKITATFNGRIFENVDLVRSH